MMTTAVELKRLVELARGGKRRARLPDDLKRALLVHVRARRSRGMSMLAIGAEVGVDAKRLHAWLSSSRSSSAKLSASRSSSAMTLRPRMVPVRVVSDVIARRDERGLIVVRGARGVSVEGLRVSDVAALLRELSL